ncbi:MAG: ACP S-malonyltransferase [Gammaproteobacteria bacterium]|nr:ACP S-malonyltransferase [Gammaproteobacteria bacterium]
MTTAFVFPGQGSQSVGMLAELASQFPIIENTFAEASEVLGYDLWALVQSGPAEDLNVTDKTQPAMLASGVAVWRLWLEQGGEQPAVMAGHSLGEYTALVCSGAISFPAAIKLVEARGRFMQSAVAAGEGGMAAILGLDDDAVISLCESCAEGDVLEAVNFNTPGQVVIAGTAAAVTRAVERAADAGAKKAVPLPVSVPSHCALMKPAAEQLKKILVEVEVQTPCVPVIHNVDVASFDDADQIKEALVRQLYQPVQWVKTINKMLDEGVVRVVECGPGKVLAGLNKRITRSTPVSPIFDIASMEKALDKD